METETISPDVRAAIIAEHEAQKAAEADQRKRQVKAEKEAALVPVRAELTEHDSRVERAHDRALETLQSCPACGGVLVSGDDENWRTSGWDDEGTYFWSLQCGDCERTLLLEIDPRDFEASVLRSKLSRS